ncbi:MAG TPA: cytochrome c oxidase subunit II [Ktedonobacteraceae bacterium]|nr:cytochrome c oxidase subunit II [Ktedonobacteraceae bacterium]
MPIFRGAKRWGIVISVLLLASLLLSACGGNPPSILDTAGPVADSEKGLFWFILVVATIVFVAVEAILIYSIVRYRERPNSPMPRQTHGNNTVEILWTVAPSIFLFAVLVGTIYTMFGLTQPTTGRTMNVTVVGHQWWWEFDYKNDHITTADELVVPTGTIVHLDLKSDNVIHSFWVPQLTGKTDVVPGHNNDKWFKADKTGSFRGECTEFCGLEHANMEFYVIAMTPDAYQTWLSGQQQMAQNANNPNVQAGKAIFTGSGGCEGCHGIVGTDYNLKSFDDPAAQALIGPNLTHFGSRRQIAGGVLSWDPASCRVVGSGNNIRIVNQESCGLYKWLHDPQGVKPGNDMAIRQLSDTEIAQLVAYLESLT